MTGSPDFSKMSMCQLRLHFQTLSQLTETLVAQMSRPLAGGPESHVVEWLENELADFDQQTVNLMDYLATSRFEGADEKFRQCMLVEYEARMADSIEAVVRVIRDVIVPAPMAKAA